MEHFCYLHIPYESWSSRGVMSDSEAYILYGSISFRTKAI